MVHVRGNSVRLSKYILQVNMLANITRESLVKTEIESFLCPINEGFFCTMFVTMLY